MQLFLILNPTIKGHLQKGALKPCAFDVPGGEGSLEETCCTACPTVTGRSSVQLHLGISPPAPFSLHVLTLTDVCLFDLWSSPLCLILFLIIFVIIFHFGVFLCLLKFHLFPQGDLLGGRRSFASQCPPEGGRKGWGLGGHVEIGDALPDSFFN